MAEADKLRDLDGWDQFDLEEIAKEDRAAAKKMVEFASRVRETYATDSGRIVLDRMIQAYLMSEIVTEHGTSFEAGIREGQARIVREILGQIEMAEKGLPGA